MGDTAACGSHPYAIGMSTEGTGVGALGVRGLGLGGCGLSHVNSFLGINPSIETRVFPLLVLIFRIRFLRKI